MVRAMFLDPRATTWACWSRRAGRWALGLCLLLAACKADPTPPADADFRGCGDGIVDIGEECDDGADNSSSRPDACRTDCRKPACGDSVKDRGEGCDDGNAWGGDGCTPACAVETGVLEQEPNDDPSSANPWTIGVIDGALREGDRDCFSFTLSLCGSVSARLDPACASPATLTLFDPDGKAVATGAPGGDRCAALDPATASGARFAAKAGTYALCVSGLLGGAVPYYALAITLVDPAAAAYPLPVSEDEDGDGKPDRCDADRDGDGVDNASDNCPDTPNGAAMPITPSRDGFLRQWLTNGPFTGRPSPKDCRPTDDNLVAADDATARPSLGDVAGGNPWIALWSYGDRLEFLTDYGMVDAPREVYSVTYVKSSTTRDLTLGVGPDDGARVWWNGVMVLDISACQGTVIDSSTVPVTMNAGWNALLVKVYDQGGGFGNYARFLAGGVPVTDLEVSLSPLGPWVSDQTDSDGDGVGDVCDKTPR